jgi:outer membrane protein assembly factor BamB
MCWAVCSSLAWAQPVGWRHDGTGVVDDAAAPLVWNQAAPAWKVPTGAWGNATPVWLDGLLCFTEEPTTLTCVRGDTGEKVWSATSDVVDTLKGAEADAKRAELAEVTELETGMRANQRKISQLRRSARRGDEEAAAALPEVSKELDRQKTAYDALRAWLTPPELDMIGYASATPVAQDGHLYAMFGNGVVSKFDAKGQRVWSVWLGPAVVPMRGYDMGSVTSPQWVDGTLLVGHGHLTALSPEDGAVRWAMEDTWVHYGTPAIARVSGKPYAVLPDGRVVRMSDGAVVAEGLGEIWYTGPIAVDDQVWLVGSKGNSGKSDNAQAWSFTLHEAGEGLRAEQRWHVVLPDSERLYASPVVHEGVLYAVSRRSHLYAMDAASGEMLYDRELSDKLRGDAYQSLMAVGDAVGLGCESAEFFVIDAGRTFEPRHLNALGTRARATPVYVGSRAFVRSLDALWAFDP